MYRKHPHIRLRSACHIIFCTREALLALQKHLQFVIGRHDIIQVTDVIATFSPGVFQTKPHEEPHEAFNNQQVAVQPPSSSLNIDYRLYDYTTANLSVCACGRSGVYKAHNKHDLSCKRSRVQYHPVPRHAHTTQVASCHDDK